MKTLQQHNDPNYLLQLRKKYFSDTSRILKLAPCDFLIRQNEQNKRLYLVLKGVVAGYLNSESGMKREIFRSEENMFVGVHSFFSPAKIVYADIIAITDCELAYIDQEEILKDGGNFSLEDFVPVIVHELSARQIFTQEVMFEKEAAMKKLFQSDKLATLGQMAAGLAHELNNAIGVINGNSEWLAQQMLAHFKETEINPVFSNFEKGVESGQSISSNEVRGLKRKLEKQLNISSIAAKKLAKMGIDENSLSHLSDPVEIEELIDRLHHFWEMGVAIHDVLLASRHSAHVLKSIKQLSVSDQARYETEVNNTIDEALTLLKNVVRNVNVIFEKEELPFFMANNGELVQIWVNIIKNGCESMLNAGTQDPVMRIQTKSGNDFIEIIIEDNGPGIPHELKSKIFQPNFTTKKGGLSFGLGLGLSIVQRLIDSYNGKIDVMSEKGKTLFVIKMPLNNE